VLKVSAPKGAPPLEKRGYNFIFPTIEGKILIVIDKRGGLSNE